MSWSHIANRGTAQNKTASRTLAIPVSGTVAVGRLLVVWSAWDNHQGAPYPTSLSFDIELMNKVTDTKGNIYMQLACLQHVGGGDGVRGALYVSKITTQLTTSDTVTIWSKDDGTTSSDIVAKCASMHEFSSTLTGWARYFSWDHDLWRTADGDVPDLVVTGVQSQGYLVLHMLAVEGPNTDAYTWDADYTQITGTGTTGGVDDSNVHIRGGWRIATFTSDTIAITSTTADRDLTHIMILLSEVDIPSADLTFPQFGVLDDFNRANEDPLASKWWFKDEGGGGWGAVPGGITNSSMKIVTNQVVKVATHADSYGKYFWNDDIPCMYGEVWATLSGVPDNVIGAGSPPTNPGRRGIGVGFQPEAQSGWEVALFREGKFQVDDALHFHFNGSFFRTHSYIGDLAVGMRIGMQMISARYFHTYIDKGSGWQWLVCHDTPDVFSYTQPFRATLRLGGKDAAVDNYGGGHPCFTPNIVRRPQR